MHQQCRLLYGKEPHHMNHVLYIQTSKVYSVGRVTDSMSGFHYQVDGLYFSAATPSGKTNYIN